SGELHGTGLGGILLHDALFRAVAASQQAGGRYVVVDAIDDNARQFYEHYGSPSRRDQIAWSARLATSKPTSKRSDRTTEALSRTPRETEGCWVMRCAGILDEGAPQAQLFA